MIRHRYDEDLDGWWEITEGLEGASRKRKTTTTKITALGRKDPGAGARGGFITKRFGPPLHHLDNLHIHM